VPVFERVTSNVGLVHDVPQFAGALTSMRATEA